MHNKNLFWSFFFLVGYISRAATCSVCMFAQKERDYPLRCAVHVMERGSSIILVDTGVPVASWSYTRKKGAIVGTYNIKM
jgi:hypothetical protein